MVWDPSEDWEVRISSDLVDELLHDGDYACSEAERKGIEWEEIVNASLIDELLCLGKKHEFDRHEALRDSAADERNERDFNVKKDLHGSSREYHQAFKESEAELKGIEWELMISSDIVDEFMAEIVCKDSEAERKGIERVKEVQVSETLPGNVHPSFFRVVSREWEFSRIIQQMQSELLLVSNACQRALSGPDFNADLDIRPITSDSSSVVSNKHQVMLSNMAECNWDTSQTKLFACDGQLQCRNSPLFNSDIDFADASVSGMDDLSYSRATASSTALAIALVREAERNRGMPSYERALPPTLCSSIPVFSMNKFERSGYLCLANG